MKAKLDIDALKRDVSLHIQARHDAWIDGPYPLYFVDTASGPIVGPLVLHLTIERHLWLLQRENPILTGRIREDKSVDALLEMLFAISPKWNPANQASFKEWCIENKDIDVDLCGVAIGAYIHKQFMCSPEYVYVQKSTKKQKRVKLTELQEVTQAASSLSSSHFAAGYYIAFHRALGWTKEQVFKTPYPQLHLMEWVLMNSNSDCKMSAKDIYINTYLESKP
jgi:hypothetical protein